MAQPPFDQLLERDPKIALPSPPLPSALATGPIRPLQFVIEIVGPRTAPSQSVKVLLHPQWANLLPSAQLFVMSGADSNWRTLDANDPAGAYDSIALAWPLPGLSPQTAQQFWNVCEDFAKQIGRRALAMPVPQDIPAVEGHLTELKNSLDIGVNFSVLPVFGAFAEKEVWQISAALGLDLGPQGAFEWRATGALFPMFEVWPIGAYAAFSLAQVQSGAHHDGLSLGFSVPVSPDPGASLDGCIHAGTIFADRLKGQFMDEEDRQVTVASAKQMRTNLGAAIQSLTKAGFPPGSAAATALFS